MALRPVPVAAAVLFAAALALAVGGYVAFGGGSRQACTLMGCGPMVDVRVDQPGERPLEVCAEEACSRPDAPSLEIFGDTDRDTIQVVVRVAGGGDEVARTKTKLSKSWPNGKRCGPSCKSARLRLTVDDKLVPA